MSLDPKHPDEQLMECVAERDRREALERTRPRAVQFQIHPAAFIFGVTIVLALVFREPGDVANSAVATNRVVAIPNHPAKMTYSQQLSRHRELGDKYHPTQEELREYLLLDGRLGVQEGQWSEDDYERWTKEKY